MTVRVTQRDIARTARVSRATVSLAMRDHHSISRKTRERIRRIAEKIGYVPDPMLVGLSAYRKSQRPVAYHNNIAWLNTHRNPQDLYMGEYREYHAGAKKRCQELGYLLEEVNLADLNFDVRALKRVLQAKGINGILLPPCESSFPVLDFDFSRFSAVRFGYSFRHPFLHTVSNAQSRTALVATRRLIELGYRRIGCVIHQEVNRASAGNFISGFLAACEDLPEEQRVAPYNGFRGVNWHDQDAVMRWIKKERIDCILGHGYWLYYIMVEKGFKIPRDVGYIDVALTQNDARLSGMRQNSLLIGQAAVTFLDGMMQRGETGIPAVPMHLYVESEWYAGASVRKQSPPLKAARSPRVT